MTVLTSMRLCKLTFVTSVFGMTNMPTVEHYWTFGIVTATVCIPFFLLIGSLNTTRGMEFWRTRWDMGWHSLIAFCSWLARCGRPRRVSTSVHDAPSDNGTSAPLPPMSRSTSAQDSKATRLRRWSQNGGSKESLELKAVGELQQSETHRPSVARSETSNIATLMLRDMERRRTLKYDV